ncbi:dihydroorotase [Flavipsychrobacter stenotrophus]|uniref:Dihydroorotase n=1 Tax=Flavipsychrobacter stenotrophus TaxID=2077091 RepID=A0A2S7SZL2_9BACT|nr:dihydroorotase [Flavipsychrobacter stenotrophus]PQJ12057.1 dihydroorotase [Flavipsychrobacter stenotrophus]
MTTILIKNVTIVNEGISKVSDILLKDGLIDKIDTNITPAGNYKEINGEGLHLLPGVIDDQVHFREPGLTHKANIHTEAAAAVAGGTTTFMEMPNTNPPAITQQLLQDKYDIAAATSVANYSFFMGVSNSNADEVLRTNDKKNEVCGVKIFMGSSTGDMLVDNYLTLNKIFSESELLIATHCEDERVITENKAKYPDADNASYHPLIRDTEACFASSFSAVQLAMIHKTRLHILHISTARELQLFTNMFPLTDKRITSEVCVHHLHFTADDYPQYGNLIKCNPAIKAKENRDALWEALLDDRLDIIATDHAPHTWEEKQQPYQQAPAGVPLVQHSLVLMLQYAKQGKLSIEKVVEKMCHAPAQCFQIAKRGYIREGYHADLVLVNMNETYTVSKENILYKCGWSPFEGHTFPAKIVNTIVNGNIVYENGKVLDLYRGQRILFDR